MSFKWTVALASAAVLMAALSDARAADFGRAQQARAEIGNGFYLWIDGSWQSVKLPDVDASWHKTTSGGPPIRDLGVMSTHSVRADGFGLRGGVGALLPSNWVLFGNDGRVELGVSYANAKGSSASSAGASNVSLYMVDGSYSNFGMICATCAYASTLDTNYTAWNVDLRFATDVKLGVVTLTPSVKGFAGNSRNEQTLTDTQANAAGVVQTTYLLSANTRWTDWGARVGLAASVPVANWLSFGLSGDIGLARRHIAFDGNDSQTSIFVTAKSSSLALDDDVTTTVANAEANLLFTPWRSVALRGFVGLNYDSKVPGFNGPSFTTNGAQGTAATLKTASEVSYYAGGGVSVKF